MQRINWNASFFGFLFGVRMFFRPKTAGRENVFARARVYSNRACFARTHTMPVCSSELKPNFA